MGRLAKALAVALVICAAGAAQARPVSPPLYVALGSSFAAGPGVGDPAPSGMPGCARSAQNYAHLFAAKRGLRLVDASCSGATTRNLLEAGQFGGARQLDAVTPDAALVTVTIGGNDVGYLGALVSRSCAVDPARLPEPSRAVACRPPPSASETDAAFARLPAAFDAVLREVRARAPGAQVVVVSYLRILPEQGDCPAIAKLSDVDAATLRTVAASLADATRAAAGRAHVRLVDVDRLSAGHDACAVSPWVAGFAPGPPGVWRQASYHPNAAGMRAVAEALDAALPRRLRGEVRQPTPTR